MPPSLTLSHTQAREILKQAYQRLYHREPSEGELNFGLATAFFESGYGRAGSANWAQPGQFAQWASRGLYNWGALESGVPGSEPTLEKFKAAGLDPVKKLGLDAGRKAYFYLFPSDLQAAEAFLMSWGRPDTLKAAATNSPQAVAAAMKNHGYYEGFWVPPGNPQGKQMPPFKEAKSAKEAAENNIRDYASALSRHVSVVGGPGGVGSGFGRPVKRDSGFLAHFLEQIAEFLASLAAEERGKCLIKVGAKDFETKLEFARVLRAILREELGTEAEIFVGEEQVEVVCQPACELEGNLEAIGEVCKAASEIFQVATKKMGGLETDTLVVPNKISTYQELGIEVAEIHRRRFRLKFAMTKEQN